MADALGGPKPEQPHAGSRPTPESGNRAFRPYWRVGLASAALLIVVILGCAAGRRGSPLVAAAVLAALAVLAKARFRDWLYPPVLQATLWTVLSVWFWLVQGSFYSVGGSTWSVIVAGAMSFSLGGWLATRRHKPVLTRNDVASASLPAGLSRAFLWAIPICILPFFLIAAFSTLRYPGAYLSLISAVREANTQGAVFGHMYIGVWWALTNLGVTLLVFLHKPWKRTISLYLALAALLALAYAVPMAGRNSILFVVVLLCAIPLVLRRIGPSRAALLFLLLAAIIFVSYTYLAGQMGLNAFSPSLADARTVTDTASLYMVGPIVALDSVRPASTAHLGQQTFRIAYLWLGYMGLNVEVKPIIQAFVPVSSESSTNIYTLYHSYYLEFGLLGVVLCQLLFGVGHGILYRRATLARPRAVWVIAYGVSLYPLMMQATTDMYLPNATNWIHFCIIFALTFRILDVFLPKPSKAVQRSATRGAA